MDAIAEIEKNKLLNLISRLEDSNLIHKISLFVNNEAKESDSIKPNQSAKGKRKAGSGKYLISYIADDFNAPLDDMFKDYMPS